MRTKVLYLVTILGLSLLLSGCRKAKKSYCHSACARCGRHRHVETKSGITVQDEIYQNEVSVWLSAYRPGPCKHIWVPVSGRGDNGSYWDAIDPWATSLHYMRKLQPTLGERATRQLLKRYYSILEKAYDPEGDDEPVAPIADSEIYRKIEQFSEELKAKVSQIDNEESPAN